MKARTRQEYRQWTTKDSIFIVKNWKKLSIRQIAEKLGCEDNQLAGFVHKLRHSGVVLESKSRNGCVKSIIEDTKKILNIK